MLKSLVNDELFLFLIRNGNLSETQLDTLLSYFATKQEGGNLVSMVEKRDRGRVTKGSFLRSLDQARYNIRSSLLSLLLLGYLGLVTEENMQSFVRIVVMLTKLRKSGGLIEFDKVKVLIEATCDRLLYV